MATFEGYERREAKILSVLKEYGINSIDECKTICEEKGIDPYTIVQETQPICFENAKWAYTVGCAIAIKMGCTKAADAAAAIGIGLQAFCIPGSVAENRKVGLGHGNLGKMLLSEETECFAFLAGHESFAAAEGAIKIALNANKVRTKPLRVILNGLGKDAAFIISRINGFTYVETEFYKYAVDWSNYHEWGFRNGTTTRNADDYCASQTYIDLYNICPDPERIRKVKANIDMLVNTPQVNDWWWIDAIQMGMPVFAKLGKLTGEQKYFDKMWAALHYQQRRQHEREHGQRNARIA